MSHIRMEIWSNPETLQDSHLRLGTENGIKGSWSRSWLTDSRWRQRHNRYEVISQWKLRFNWPSKAHCFATLQKEAVACVTTQWGPRGKKSWSANIEEAAGQASGPKHHRRLKEGLRKGVQQQQTSEEMKGEEGRATQRGQPLSVIGAGSSQVPPGQL